MSQAKPEVIEIFCRVLSQELTRETGHKIKIDPRSLPGYSVSPGNVLKDRKCAKNPKHSPENLES
jgi:hypothetical protein